MSDWLHAVEKLTRPWSDVLSPELTGNGYTPVNYPPLLDMLDEACRSNTGNRGGNGADPAERSLLDLQAFTLREHIDGTVRAWVSHLSKGRAEKDLKAAVVQLAALLQAHHAAHTITASEHERITAFFPRWVESIWTVVDPPNMREVQKPCPRCSVEWMPVDDTYKRAVWIEYREKLADATASCRACGATWGTLREMVEIGIDTSEFEQGAA